MTPSRSAVPHRRFLGAVLALAAVAVIGLVLITVAVTGTRASPPAAPGFETSTTAGPPAEPSTSPAPSPTRDRAPTTTPSSRAKPEKPGPAALQRSEPESIRIRSIGVDATFVGLGLDENRELEGPEDPDQVGWFTDAPSPGVPGVAVVAGHVTWNRAPTVFHRLGELKTGARIDITRADGSVATFAARRRATFAKDEFPTAEVYRPAAQPELVLITCGGAYDSDTHSYDSNVIVWAELVDSTPATR